MTPQRARIDVAEVRARLTAETVLDAYGPRQIRSGRRKGRVYRLADCPRCNVTSKRGAIAVYKKDGEWRWRHHGADCGGSMIDLVGALAGVDTARDFGRALEIAARLAGILTDTSTDDLVRRLAERELSDRMQREQEVAEDRERRLVSAREWSAISERHAIGEAYLRSRGLDPEHYWMRRCVRYSLAGDICVRLHSLEDSELVTVTRRLLVPPPWDATRKIHTPLGGTTRGTLCGRIVDVGPADTIVTEGILDTLTAKVIWPDAVVLGASGAGQLARVVERAARRAVRFGGRLMLVPDNDDVGRQQAIRAGYAAIEAGLTMGRSLLVVEVPEHDLNDSYRAGWRP